MFFGPRHIQRTTLNVNYHHRHARGLDSLQQLLLSTQQGKRGPVETLAAFHIAHVIFRSDSRTCLLITCTEVAGTRTTHYHDSHVRRTCHTYSLLYISIFHVTNSTAFDICHMFCSQRFTKSFAYRHHIVCRLRSRIVTQHVILVVGIRPDHRYPVYFLLIQRKQRILVLQENDGLTSHLAGHGHMFRRAHLFLGQPGIDIRMFEQPHLKLQTKDTRGSRIDQRLRHSPRTDGSCQCAKSLTAQIDIQTSRKRLDSRFVQRRGHSVVFINAIDTIQVGHGEAPEPPFAAQDIAQQMRIHRARHAVHRIVGRHHRQRPRLDSCTERQEKVLPQVSHTNH